MIKEGWAALSDPTLYLTRTEDHPSPESMNDTVEVRVRKTAIFIHTNEPVAQDLAAVLEWFQRAMTKLSRATFILAAFTLPCSVELPDLTPLSWTPVEYRSTPADDLALKVTIFERRCATCGATKGIEDFPSKGGNRRERSCKSCFNHARKEQRQFTNGKKEAKLLSCRTSISGGAATNWCSALAQILISSMQKGHADEQVVDLVHGSKNRIVDLLEKA